LKFVAALLVLLFILTIIVLTGLQGYGDMEAAWKDLKFGFGNNNLSERQLSLGTRNGSIGSPV